MKLTKKIPARTVTYTALWVKRDFMEMTPRFREIRSKSRNPMDTCFWCNHKFEDGETMGLASFSEVKIGNKVLCQSCCDELEKTDARE